MNEFIEKLIGRLKAGIDKECVSNVPKIRLCDAIEIVKEFAEEHKDNAMINGQYCWQTCGATEHCQECNRLCNGSIDYYENYDFMAEEHNGGWIPCDENLPNHNQTVIFQTEDGMVEAGHYDVNEDWCVNDSYFPNAFRFVAWQPLPEPYQKKEGAE